MAMGTGNSPSSVVFSLYKSFKSSVEQHLCRGKKERREGREAWELRFVVGHILEWEMRWHIIAAITRSLHINHAGFSVVLLRACWMQGAEKCMEDGHATVCTCNEDLCNRAASTLDFSKRTSSKLFILLMSSLVTLFINSWWLISHLPSAFVITAKCDNKTSASPSNFVKQQPKYNEIPEVFSMYRRRYWRRKRQFVWLVAFSRFITDDLFKLNKHTLSKKEKKVVECSHISPLLLRFPFEMPPFKKCKMVKKKKKGVCAAEKWMRLLTPTAALKCLQAVPPPLWWSRNLCRNIYSPIKILDKNDPRARVNDSLFLSFLKEET